MKTAMKSAVAVLAAAMIGSLSSCQSSSAAASATITPPGPTSTIVRGALARPAGPIYLPGDVVLSAPSSTVVWALLNGTYLYRSIDQGSTWEQRPLHPRVRAGAPAALTFVDAEKGWLLLEGLPETQCNAASASVWQTADGGVTWPLIASVDRNDQTSVAIGYSQCKTDMTFTDAEHGFIIAEDENNRPTIYRTSDGGRTWAASSLPDPPGFTTKAGGFVLQPGEVQGFGNTLLVAARCMQASCSERFVFRSTDGGASWSFAATVTQGQLPVTFVTATRWVQLIAPGESSETNDAGLTWNPSPSDYSQAAPVAAAVVFGDPSVGYATVRGQIQRTLDGGLTWAYINTPGVQPG